MGVSGNDNYTSLPFRLMTICPRPWHFLTCLQLENRFMDQIYRIVHGFFYYSSAAVCITKLKNSTEAYM